MLRPRITRPATAQTTWTGLMEHLAKVPRRPAAGYLEGFQTVVTAVKANEAVWPGKRIELKPELYELK